MRESFHEFISSENLISNKDIGRVLRYVNFLLSYLHVLRLWECIKSSSYYSQEGK